MSDDKKMTAAEAWAEVDRLDKESDAACSKTGAAHDAWKALSAESSRLVTAWSEAMDRADAIGPRPEVPS